MPDTPPGEHSARAVASDLPALTAEQAAERLGIKLETLYAYVARGRLARTRTASGSAFDPLEVERFAASRRQRSAASPAPSRGHSDGRPLMVIETGFAHIEDDELRYRDRDAVDLATRASFETVARWALTGEWADDARFDVAASPLRLAGLVAAALPPAATGRDRQQVAVTAFAATDPLRYSLDPGSIVSATEAMVAGMVEVLPLRGDASTGTSIAARLWARLSAQPPTEPGLRVLNAALILLIDHDLAISTLAARAAASARANPYAVVTAGLGALDSPLHGNASRAAFGMLARVHAGEQTERVIADTMVTGRQTVPGFGQALYRDGDPRARAVLALLRAHPEPGAAGAMRAVDRLADVVRSRTGAEPNIDLALAALALERGMPDDAGEVVFATARTVGWIVHALDEYRRRPLRLRPVGRYSPDPSPTPTPL